MLNVYIYIYNAVIHPKPPTTLNTHTHSHPKDLQIPAVEADRKRAAAAADEVRRGASGRCLFCLRLLLSKTPAICTWMRSRDTVLTQHGSTPHQKLQAALPLDVERPPKRAARGEAAAAEASAAAAAVAEAFGVAVPSNVSWRVLHLSEVGDQHVVCERVRGQKGGRNSNARSRAVDDPPPPVPKTKP